MKTHTPLERYDEIHRGGWVCLVGFFPSSLTALVSFFTKSGYIRWKGKKKKKEHVINKEPKLGELIKYEYRSKELNVS